MTKRLILSNYPGNNIYSIDDGKFKKINDTNKIILPPKSVYFHFNEELLDDFLPLTSPNQSTVEKSEYNDKNLLLVGSGSIDFKRLQVLLSIKRLGLKRLVCLSRSKTWADPYVDDWIIAENEDVSHKNSVLESIQSYMNDNDLKFDGVITYDDFCTNMTSFIAEKLNLPGIPLEISLKIKNKYEFRNLCEKCGINSAKTFLIESGERFKYCETNQKNEKFVESLDGKRKIDLPVIVKNPFGVGKDFAKKCNTRKEFIDSIKHSIEINGNMNLVVEEFYEGKFIFSEL